MHSLTKCLALLAVTVFACSAVGAQPTLYGIRWHSDDPGFSDYQNPSFGAGELLRMDLATGHTDTLHQGQWLGSLALDVEGDKIYWAAHADLLRSNLDGSNTETIMDEQTFEALRRDNNSTGTHCDHNIALDLPRGKLYSIGGVCWGGGHFFRVNLDGSEPEWIEGIEGGTLAIDSENEKIYWGDWGQLIKRANLDGSGEETLVDSAEAHQLQLDSAAGRMYWLNRRGVFRANLDGTDVEYILDSGRRLGWGSLGLDLPSQKMYFFGDPIERGDGTVEPDSLYRCNLDGTDLEAVLGGIEFEDIALAQGGLAVSVEPSESIQHSYALSPAYPNPFNPTTTISYTLPRTADVTLTVVDLVGRTVAVLESGTKAGGTHEATFEAAGYPSGVYFYRFETADFVETKSLILTR